MKKGQRAVSRNKKFQQENEETLKHSRTNDKTIHKFPYSAYAKIEKKMKDKTYLRLYKW